MKFTTIHLGENKIEFFNSMLGKETVKVNGEIVSTKSSISGAEHLFTISENNKMVDCKLVTGLSMNGVAIDLYKDGKPVIESPKGGGNSTIIFIIIIGLIAGFLMAIL